MKKPVFYTEAAYGAGLLLLAAGTALTEYSGLGLSMVVAPAYMLHLKMSGVWAFFTFGVAEYVLQAAVLLGMMLLLRKARLAYLFSFVTAVLYGFALDGAMLLTAMLPDHSILRYTAYVAGVPLCGAAIALLFRSYLPPEAYEMFVKELSRKWRKPIPTVKTAYDCCSLVAAAVMSFAFFGALRGIGVGTLLCALLNGVLIRLFGSLYDRLFLFRDALPLRTYFEESEKIS